MATRITSSEVVMGTCTPKPCATNFPPTKTRITANPYRARRAVGETGRDAAYHQAPEPPPPPAADDQEART